MMPNSFSMASELKAASRYSSHLALASVGPEGQQKIKDSRIGLIGLGGLGCPAALYLQGAGVGQLTLCDFDRVSVSNLARQLLYTEADEGRYKVDVAAERLSDVNPEGRLAVIRARMDTDQISRLMSENDMIIDASDNYGTRLAVNRAALNTGTPWVMGSCIRMEGQVALFRPGDEACYRCAYGTAPETLEDCPGAGILSTVAGLIGSMMAHMALSHILSSTKPEAALHVFDGQSLQWLRLKRARNQRCPECGTAGP